jgi:hypothetical protein
MENSNGLMGNVRSDASCPRDLDPYRFIRGGILSIDENLGRVSTTSVRAIYTLAIRTHESKG